MTFVLLPMSTAKRKVIGQIRQCRRRGCDHDEGKNGNQIQVAQDEAKALLRQRGEPFRAGDHVCKAGALTN